MLGDEKDRAGISIYMVMVYECFVCTSFLQEFDNSSLSPLPVK